MLSVLKRVLFLLSAAFALLVPAMVAAQGTVYDPFANQDVPGVINGVIRFLLGFVGALFLAMFVYGGLLWFTAAGDEKKVASAKSTLGNAALGIAIVMLSYGLVSVVLQYISTVSPLESDSTVKQAEQGTTQMQGGPSDTGTQTPTQPTTAPQNTPGVTCSTSNCQTTCQATCLPDVDPATCSGGCSSLCADQICNRIPTSVANCQAQCGDICVVTGNIYKIFGNACTGMCQQSCSSAVHVEQ